MNDPTTHFVEHEADGLAGRLLIAMPQLKGTAFARAVILICQHDRDHAFGVIVNKPIKGLKAKDAVANLGLEPALTAGNLPVFFGGPCEPTRGFVLHTLDYANEDTVRVSGGYGLSANRAALERLKGDQYRPGASRLVAGYAGWSAGQLDDELREQSWLDVGARHDLVFSADAGAMWEDALATLGLDEHQLWAMQQVAAAGQRVN